MKLLSYLIKFVDNSCQIVAMVQLTAAVNTICGAARVELGAMAAGFYSII